MRLQMFLLMGADDALETDILVKIKTADFYFHLIQKRCVYPPPPRPPPPPPPPYKKCVHPHAMPVWIRTVIAVSEIISNSDQQE